MPWRRIISWAGLLAVSAAAAAVGLRRLRPELPVGAVELPPDDGTVTLPSEGPPAHSGTDSADRTPAEENDAMERRWWALTRVRYLPPFIKRYARRRVDTIAARHAVQYFGRQDPADNQATRIPDGEEVHVPAIWLTELYTPTTLAGLLDGLPPFLAKAQDRGHDREDLVEWVRAARRRGGGAWQMLPYVFPPDSNRFWPDRIVDTLPDGIAFARLGIYTLTSTVTAVTTMFRLEEEHSRALGSIVNQDRSFRTRLLPHGGGAVSDVRPQKQEAADAWRAQLRDDVARWLAARFPGSFNRLAPGQLPTIELLLTEQQRPWEEPADQQRGRDWTELLDLEGFDGYWQCADPSWLRFHERRFRGRRPGQRHILTLAGLRPEFLETRPPSPAGTGQVDEAVQHLDFYVVALANRWALTPLLLELDEQLAATRDLAERSGGERSPRALTQIQQQLLRTGMDSQIVAADIVRYAQNDASWRRDILDFHEVLPSAFASRATPRASLADTMRQGQINQGNRVTQAEAGLRELLNTSAQLTAAAENLRLQRRVLLLTVVSLIVAAVAAAAAVIALRISSNTPPATPTPTLSPSSSLTSGNSRLSDIRSRTRHVRYKSSRSNSPLGPPWCLGVGERIQHEVAPRHSRVHGEPGVSRPQADALTCRAVPGAVATVPQFIEALRDAHQGAEYPLHRVRPVWASMGRTRMEVQRSLRFADQGRELFLVTDQQASLGEHDLGRALDQLLGYADRQGGIVVGRSLEPVEVFLDRSRITQVSNQLLADRRPGEPGLESIQTLTSGPEQLSHEVASALPRSTPGRTTAFPVAPEGAEAPKRQADRYPKALGDYLKRPDDYLALPVGQPLIFLRAISPQLTLHQVEKTLSGSRIVHVRERP
jgi:hypothetical protein